MKARWRPILLRHERRGRSDGVPFAALALAVPLVIVNLFYLELFEATGECCGWPPEHVAFPMARHIDELRIVPVIEIGASGDIRLGATDTALHELPDRLQEAHATFVALHEEAKDGAVFTGEVNLVADRATPFGLIRRVLAACRAGGYPQVSFVAEHQPVWWPSRRQTVACCARHALRP